MKEMNVGVLGATGAVGQEMLKILAERDFPVRSVRPLASARSAGKTILFKGETVPIVEAKEDAFRGLDLVLGAAENDIAKRFAPHILDAGAVFVDNSSAFRLREDVPLIVPEINPEDAKWHKGIIANPNCTTIVTLVAVAPLAKASPIETMIASSYQAVSGAGVAGMRELTDEIEAGLKGEPYAPKAFAHQIAYNVIPQIGSEQYLGYTSEEMKMQNEGRKILHLPAADQGEDLRGPGSCAYRRRPRLQAGGRSSQSRVPHAPRYLGPGSHLRGAHPGGSHLRQRTQPLVLRRPGPQRRRHQRGADRGIAALSCQDTKDRRFWRSFLCCREFRASDAGP